MRRLRGELVAALVPLACAGCSPDPEVLPPLGEVLVVVDTDAPVPDLAGRLRADVYAADGAWIDSIDLPTREPSDWPGSFVVYSDAQHGEHEILVRLRAYPDGRVREYRGERFSPIPTGGAITDVIEPPSGDGNPRLLHDGADVTPETEPLPNLAIDRLVRARIHYGKRRKIRVVLRTACVGTQANVAGAQSCAETAHLLEPAPLLASDSAATSASSELGAADSPAPCTEPARPAGSTDDGAPLYDEEACIDGGMFVLGSQAVAVSGDIDHYTDLGGARMNGTPERFARIGALRVDRYEVTVGRYRQALHVDGFQRPDGSPLANDGPLATSFKAGVGNVTLCTYTTTAGDREDMPLTCISWFNARAFCQFYGGDLPTESEWEYIAARAGRAAEAAYPWGDASPSCDRGVFARAKPSDVPIGSAQCAALGFGPARVGESMGDATPAGVVGLSGNVAEWVLDSYASYASTCWASATLDRPQCWEEAPENRSIRGATWVDSEADTLSASRDGARTDLVTALVGFRCVRRGASP